MCGCHCWAAFNLISCWPKCIFIYLLLIQQYLGSRPSTRWHDKIFPGEQNTSDFRTINFLSVFWSAYRCLGDHFTNGIRNISTCATLSFFVCFSFVFRERHGDWMANEIRTIFYIFVIVSYFVRQGDPLANKIRMRGTFALNSFFVCHSGAMAPEIRVKKYSRPMIVFSAYIKCLFANAYFIRGDYVTHSPRMIFAHSPRRSYAFAPKELRIRPEWFTHSPRRCYTFSPKVLRIRPEGVTHSSGRTKYDHSCY